MIGWLTGPSTDEHPSMFSSAGRLTMPSVLSQTLAVNPSP
nr:MAG TPA: hypothetical protein [Bacteriophage sp.]